MSSEWLREYTQEIFSRGWVRLLALFTILGGIPGIVYLAKEVRRTVPWSVFLGLCILFVLSMIINIRQAFLWKPEWEGRRSAEEMSKRWQKQAEASQQLYKEEEQRGWTPAGLTYQTGELPPTRMTRPHGIQVKVGSLDTPIEDPIRLRFWFSKEVDDSPLVWFLPDYTHYTTVEIEESMVSGAASIEVGPNGRLDVEWTGERLHGDARLVVGAYAKETGAEIDLLSVERRRW